MTTIIFFSPSTRFTLDQPIIINTMGKFIDPLTDWGFKRLFGSEPTKDILIAFLNDLFAGEKVITDVVYGPNEHVGPERGLKRAILDLFCTSNKGEKLIIEMQRSWQDFFRERSIFYVSRTVSEELPGGKEHFRFDIPEVYLIAVLEFRMNKEPSLGYKFIEPRRALSVH